jgi:primosomal protein N'
MAISVQLTTRRYTCCHCAAHSPLANFCVVCGSRLLRPLPEPSTKPAPRADQ